MAAMDFDATNVPTDVVAALSLTAGIKYTGQNVSTTATLFIREVSSQPAANARAFKMEAGANFVLEADSGPIYLWTDDDAGCPVILNEAP